jgi:hypothetical protein
MKAGFGVGVNVCVGDGVDVIVGVDVGDGVIVGVSVGIGVWESVIVVDSAAGDGVVSTNSWRNPQANRIVPTTKREKALVVGFILVSKCSFGQNLPGNGTD